MTDLLGLLRQVEEHDKALGQSLRALLESVAEMHAEDKATIRELEANARLGELVQGMPVDTSLHHTAGGWVTKVSVYGHDRWIERIQVTAGNPIDALQTIQEKVGDG